MIALTIQKTIQAINRGGPQPIVGNRDAGLVTVGSAVPDDAIILKIGLTDASGDKIAV